MDLLSQLIIQVAIINKEPESHTPPQPPSLFRHAAILPPPPAPPQKKHYRQVSVALSFYEASAGSRCMPYQEAFAPPGQCSAAVLLPSCQSAEPTNIARNPYVMNPQTPPWDIVSNDNVLQVPNGSLARN